MDQADLKSTEQLEFIPTMKYDRGFVIESKPKFTTATDFHLL